MKMYRAVPKQGFQPTAIYQAQATRRLPSNIPYLVDNLWEWLRPEHAPSRRHAVYASPTPELALANASAAGNDPSLYVACEMVVHGLPAGASLKLAHLAVTDARQHGDIGKLVRHVVASLGSSFAGQALLDKLRHAVLFMPGGAKDELAAYFADSASAATLATELQALSTFWADASFSPQDHNGELFFELPAGASYQLLPL